MSIVLRLRHVHGPLRRHARAAGRAPCTSAASTPLPRPLRRRSAAAVPPAPHVPTPGTAALPQAREEMPRTKKAQHFNFLYFLFSI